MPRISIIIPTYNAQVTIKSTILSVQLQTIQDFELLIIDDGSTDQTLEILETVKDPRIKISTYQNSGVAAARNRGIEQSSGEFLSF
ncbi:MAG: glycosyltransferase family 2 protein [Acaryochloridaceae cyanobacterium SU_2_1]|nr:glycosyltransferase family 2 protein [Acaryochloridaceae cyanobacterium SU_2_1]